MDDYLLHAPYEMSTNKFLVSDYGMRLPESGKGRDHHISPSGRLTLILDFSRTLVAFSRGPNTVGCTVVFIERFGTLTTGFIVG